MRAEPPPPPRRRDRESEPAHESRRRPAAPRQRCPYLEQIIREKAGPFKQGFRLVVSPNGDEGSLHINQDARVYATLLGKGEKAELDLVPGRHAWLQLARGTGTLNGVALKAGDGAAVSGETGLVVTATAPLEALLFDLA